MKWIEALKKYNSENNTGKWCIPRKGSADYDIVKKIMSAEKVVNLDQGYIKYSKQEKPKLKKDQPQLTSKQVSEIVSKMWKTLGPTEKRAFL